MLINAEKCNLQLTMVTHNLNNSNIYKQSCLASTKVCFSPRFGIPW